MKKRKTLITVLAICAVLTIGVGTTLAFLTSMSRTLENVFTVGKVNITLTESETDRYLILPGTEITQDPLVTVKAESDDCWLFVKAEKSSDFDMFMTYSPSSGWKAVEGETGVFYREVSDSDQNQYFKIIKDDKVTVLDSVTEEELKGLTKNPTLTFTAYAIQKSEIADAETAWSLILEEMEEDNHEIS